MAIFKVEKTNNYTVMSNYHLRDKRLSLKAKGLLSQMLSLPENWDYTLRGLTAINRESIDAIRTAVLELEKNGYITRQQGRDAKGKMTNIEYTIYEKPRLDQPNTENPILENPNTDNPNTGNPTQLNKEKQSKEKQIKDKTKYRNQSILSKGTETMDTDWMDTYSQWEQRFKNQLEFEDLLEKYPDDTKLLEELLGTILSCIMTNESMIKISGNAYPKEFVQNRFSSLRFSHMEYILECLHKTTTEIKNIKQYLLSMLFNAPITIESYYTTQVQHDMYGTQ